MSVGFEELAAQARRAWGRFAEPRRPVLLVGCGTCGLAAGAREVLEAARRRLKERGIRARVAEVGCLGLCYAEPLVEVRVAGLPSVLYGRVGPELAARIVDEHVGRGRPVKSRALAVMDGGELPGVARFEELPAVAGQQRRLMRNCGRIEPAKLEHYVALGGYSGLLKALTLAPEAVIEEVKEAGLRGRGGIGFPTGLKWELTRKAGGEQRFIVANAEEGEPGTFKDRILIESDPHALLEGMLIAGYAVGARRGFIFVQAEYGLGAAALVAGVKALRKAGICGPRVLGTGFAFDIEVRGGVGSYACGEESGALECIEGRGGRPRVRPPYPAERGLLGQPTAVNNVETLANVPLVLREGAAAYRALGTERSPGTKIFTLSGNLRRPGAYELPLGTPLKDLLEMAGGPRRGSALPAVLIGGPTGGFVPSAFFDYPLDFESLREIGAMMGSGAIIAPPPSHCVVESVRHMVAFIEEESCGKCVPCRIGVRQMRLLLDKIVELRAGPEDLAALGQICEALPVAALCGLGQAAPNPVLNSLRHFKDEYDAHVLAHNCTVRPKRKRRAAASRSR